MPLISSLGVMNAINFGMASSSVRVPFMAINSGGMLTAYIWDSTTGYGANLNPVGGSSINGISINPNGTKVACAIASYVSPNSIEVYPWLLGTGGFGTKDTNIYGSSGTSSAANDIAYSTNGADLVVAPGDVSMAAFSNSTGTRYSGAAGGTGLASATSIGFNPSGNAIYATNATSPYLYVYAWTNGVGFGTKFTDPATLLIGVANNAIFSGNGNYIAATITAANTNINAYPWSVSGFGTKFSNPATAINGNAFGLAFSTTSTEIVATYRYTPYTYAYSFSSSGFGTKLTDPTLSNFLNTNAMVMNGNKLFYGIAASPFIQGITWSSSGYGTAIASPSTPLSNAISASVKHTIKFST